MSAHQSDSGRGRFYCSNSRHFLVFMPRFFSEHVYVNNEFVVKNRYCYQECRVSFIGFSLVGKEQLLKSTARARLVSIYYIR